MITEIIFLVLLMDAIIAVLIAWTKLKEKFNNMKLFKRYFPITRGWTMWYLTLVLFIGYLIYFT